MSQSRCSQCHDPRDALKRFSSCLWRKKVLDGVIAIGQTTSKVSFLLRSSLPCFGSLPSLPSMRFLSLSTFSLCILLFRLPFCLTISLQSFRLCRCINWNLIVKVKTTVSDWFTHGQYTVKNCLRVPSIPSLSPPPCASLFHSLLSRTSNSVSNGELFRRTVFIPWRYRSTWNNPSGRSGLLRTFLLPSIVH